MTYTFFWHEDEENGYLSNWYESPFIIDDFQYFCVEQYMMSQKAALFHDEATKTKILRADTPRECKACGRLVAPFDPAVWNVRKRAIVKTALTAKFAQNEALLGKLLATGDSLLAEASPYDAVWGIGLTAEEARQAPPDKWPGQNLLGTLLMEVRAELKQA